MSTKAQTARINGAKSNGPVTPEGKAISAQNSLKHGLNSSRVVLPHESQEEYDALKSRFIARFEPADEVEAELVIEMVSARWRLRRIELMEAALFKKAMREQQQLLGPDADPSDVQDAAYAEVAESKTARTLASHARQLRSAYEKAWRELGLLQDDRLEREENEREEENEPTIQLTPAMIESYLQPPASIKQHRPATADQPNWSTA